MDAEGIYQKAIKKLHHLTYGKFEHDENKAIELFDKLLSRGIKFHCDDVKRICQPDLFTAITRYSSSSFPGWINLLSVFIG